MVQQMVSWSDSYNLGLDAIDAQHRSLFELINAIWQAVVERGDQGTIVGLIEDLEKYTVAHFTAEEAYMQSIGYPELDTHKNAHRDFVDRVAREKQHAIETSAFSLDLIHYLREWLVNHIRVTDKRYADYTSTKQQAPSENSLLARFFRRFS